MPEIKKVYKPMPVEHPDVTFPATEDGRGEVAKWFDDMEYYISSQILNSDYYWESILVEE